MGDELLRRTARFLKENVRASDEVVRWGGDEFLILMPRTDGTQAAGVVRRFMTLLGSHNGDYGGVPVNFSIGVSIWEPGRDVEDLLREVDARMYEQKRGGWR